MSSELILLHDVAIASVLDRDQEFYYRSICRAYSQAFHTPLHEVFDLPQEIVLTNYFEHAADQLSEEDLEETVERILNPDKTEEEEEDIQRFIGKVLEEDKLLKSKKKDGKSVSIRKEKESLDKAREAISSEEDKLLGDDLKALAALDDLDPL